jgi:hypothetical protein
MAVSFDLAAPHDRSAVARRLDRHQTDPSTRVYDRCRHQFQERGRLSIMDILISIARWLALSAGAIILFGALLVGLLAWLLNRPVD